ncbi:hypothetical protein BKA56DRAFT_693439 [Ilyonectria sp. MPI-CAGE-AT-0026]|nr:hypothetical protein BKA56DRAFT_693439 [Ilyonectria sp. MPI-CAGE-AT-0026]
MVSNFGSRWQLAWDMHALTNGRSGSNLRLYARRHGVATGGSTNYGRAACLLLEIVECGGVKQLKPPAVSVVCPESFVTSVLFRVLLSVSTTVNIQRDCIKVVSTHAKARESFGQLLGRIAGFHVSDQSRLVLVEFKQYEVLKAAPLRPRLAFVRGWLPGGIQPRPVEGGADAFPVEEGLAGGLFEAQADAVFPVEPAGVPVQDEAAAAVGVTTPTADHLWRGGVSGRACISGARDGRDSRGGRDCYRYGRCSSDDRPKGSKRDKWNGISPNEAQPSKRNQLDPHHLA